MAQDLLKDVVYKRIREMIINGTLPMGSKLSETVLAKRLEATKAPIRDAVKRLQSEGLVQIKPQSGTFVFSLSQTEFNELLEFRYYIESQAMQLSFEKNNKALCQSIRYILDKMSVCMERNGTLEYLGLDNEFHQVLIDFCDNAYFAQAYALIAIRMATARNYLGSNEQHMQRSYEQHVSILQALQSSDVQEAKNLLRSHILPDKGAYWGDILLRFKD